MLFKINQSHKTIAFLKAVEQSGACNSVVQWYVEIQEQYWEPCMWTPHSALIWTWFILRKKSYDLLSVQHNILFHSHQLQSKSWHDEGCILTSPTIRTTSKDTLLPAALSKQSSVLRYIWFVFNSVTAAELYKGWIHMSINTKSDV